MSMHILSLYIMFHHHVHAYFIFVHNVSPSCPCIFYLSSYNVSPSCPCIFYLSSYDVSPSSPCIFYLSSYDVLPSMSIIMMFCHPCLMCYHLCISLSFT